jgi:endonuclease V
MLPLASPQNGSRRFRIKLLKLTSSEQIRLSQLVIQHSSISFSGTPPFDGLHYIAGVDISFVKNTNQACAMLAILEYPSMNIVYKTHDIVEMKEDYIPFYLAFREVQHLVALFRRVHVNVPELYPQVVFVDGSGVWHPKGFSCLCIKLI